MYKKIFSKTTFFTLVSLLLLTLCLFSCGSSQASAVTCGNVTVNEDIYRYWYSELKDYYLDSYSDVVDTQQYWETVDPNLGVTYGEFIDDKIRTQIDYYVAGNQLFDELELKSVLKDTWKSVKSLIDEEIDDAIASIGGRADYNKYLDNKYGIDTDTYRTVRLMEQKFYLVYDYLYNSETGIDLATESEIDFYYQSRYARIKYYMVLKNYSYRLDKDGNRVMDSTGSYIQDALTEAEKIEKANYANEVFEAVKSGTHIDVYLKKDYPDLLNSAPNGYYVIQNEYYGYLFTSTVINAAFDAEVGETVFAENDDAFFIIQRYNLPDKAYKGSDSAQFDEIANYAVNDKFEERFSKIIATIERNDEVCGKYSVITID